MAEKPSVVLAVAGNIGAGKSTLVRAAVSRQYREMFLQLLDAHQTIPRTIGAYEERFDPPLLGLYSENPEKYALSFQVSMLVASSTLDGVIAKEGGIAFLDRTIYEHRHVFGELQRKLGNLNETDFSIYDTLFQSISKFVPPPSAYLRLTASEENLRKRIAARGRPQEKWLLEDNNYLRLLEESFDHFFKSIVKQPVIEVPADEIILAGEGDLDHDYFERTFPYIVRKIKELKILESVK